MALFICFLCGIAAPFLFACFPVATGISAAAASLLLLRRRAYLPLAVFILCAAYVLARGSAEPRPAPELRQEVLATGWFLEGDRKGYSFFEIDEAVDPDTGEEYEALEGQRVLVEEEGDDPDDGKQALLLEARRDRTRLNPGARPGETFSWRIVSGPAPVSDGWDMLRGWRDSLIREAGRRFTPETAALVIALTTGETSFIDPVTREAFNVTGLAHILSISGTHFGLFSVMVFGAVVFLLGRLPGGVLLRLTLFLTPRQAAALLTLPVMVLYLGLSGSSIPAVRSFIMVSLFLAGLLIERRHAGMRSLMSAAVLICLWMPEAVLDLSFQLSFLAVAAIGLVTDKEAGPATGTRERLHRALKMSVALSLAATLATAPLVAYAFHYVSVLSPLANLLVAPLIGFVVVPLSVTASFLYLLSGSYPFVPLIASAAEVSLWLVRHLAMVPYADLKIPAFPPVLLISSYACLFAFSATRKKAWLAASIAPVAAFQLLGAIPERDLAVTFVDVGQGDSAVVSLPDGKTVVIDCGRSGNETLNLLKYEGVRRIDALVLSHSHPDHAGGAGRILERFPVTEVWQNGTVPLEVPDGTVMRALGRGDTVEASGYRISVLHPYPEFFDSDDGDYDNDNNTSLVLKVEGKTASFLFAGDLLEEAEDDLAHLGERLRSDVLKAPHHGSRASVHPLLDELVRPSVTVFSAGRGNPFGHPSSEMLASLAGSDIYRTDLHGAIRVTGRRDGLEVRTWRGATLERAYDLPAEWRNIRRVFSVW